MPPRLLAVPAGMRLTPGVVPGSGRAAATRLVVSGGVPASAVTGCGARRGVAVHAAAPPHGGYSSAANKDPEYYFYRFLLKVSVRALRMLESIEPPAVLLGKAEEIKTVLETSKAGAEARRPKKEELVVRLLRGVYGVVDLAEECTPRESWMSPYLPTKLCHQAAGGKATLMVGHKAAITFDLCPEDTAIMMGAVSYAVNQAVAATVRCVGPAAVDKMFPFADPEE